MHPDWFTSTSTSGREGVPRARRWTLARPHYASHRPTIENAIVNSDCPPTQNPRK